MSEFIDRLLRHPGVERGNHSSQGSISAVVELYGEAFPESLLSLWRAVDGVAITPLDAHILGPSEVLRLIESGGWPDQLLQQGFVPVLDDHQSDYLIVIVRAPLAFRIALLPHDDGSRLLYRNLEGLAKALLDALDLGRLANSFFHGVQGDYPPDTPRPQNDQDAAQALMATDGTQGEWNYAAQLLDAGNIAEWARLLETDHFVRRDVLTRMRQMGEPAIQEMLKQDRIAFEAFAQATAKAARAAGLKVGRRSEACLQIGGKWMDLEAFFHRRNIPNAMPRMISWFEDLIEGRNPHLRAGHFMAD